MNDSLVSIDGVQYDNTYFSTWCTIHPHYNWPHTIRLAHIPKRIKPVSLKAYLIFSGSRAKSEYILSNSFQAIESVECLIVFTSLTHLSLSYLMCLRVCLDMNNLCNLGLSGKYHNTSLRTFFLCSQARALYLVSLHTGHLSFFSCSL